MVAARLSETGAKVILLEAGPKDSLLWIHIPAGMLKLLHHPVVNWNYNTEGPTAVVAAVYTGRVARRSGGSSSINGMLYVRGNPADFDGWAQMGCRGWSFDDVLPYFRKSEDYKQGADAEYRGKSGPLKVEDYRTILPLTHQFIEAAQQAGHKFSKDLNGRQAGGRRLLADDAQGQVARLDRADLPEGGAGAAEPPGGNRGAGEKLLFEGKRCVGVAFASAARR